MTNGDKFMEVFGGLYATELWAKPEDEFLEWLASLYEPTEELNEWCDDCKEYDHKKHCCPRWNRVIKRAIEEVKANQTADVKYDVKTDAMLCGNCEQVVYQSFHWVYCPYCGAKLDWR